METRSISTRRMTILAIAVLMIALVVGFVMLGHEMKLDKIQTAALEELETGRGTYDAQSIVLYDTNRAEAEELAEKLGASLRITKDGRFATLTLPEGVTIEDVYSSKENRELLSKFSVDYEVRTTDVDELTAETATRLTSRPEYTVTDTEYSLQTYYDYLNLKNTWAYTEGYGVTVAVIDTGIDTDHPEFAGKISEYSYNASEDKIVKDYDISVIEDEQGHGTAVAGVIAAQFDGVGTIGIAPDVTLIVIKAECDENGNFKRTSDLVFGLYYAIERDVDVVNMSFGTGENAFASATQLAIDSDIICVAAAGNKSTSELTWPAADENVIGVGALADGSWELAEYSNYGENVNVVAPGTVYTTAIGGGYGTINGTSFSSPITAGVIALYLSQNRYQEFRNVTEVLYASCYDLGDLGCDWYYGYGAVDVSALMLEEKGTVTFNYLTDEIEETKQVFVRNHTLQDIPEPDRLYAVFDGWYYDEQCTEELSLYADKFTTDLTLYASWVNEDDGVPYTYVELDDGTIEIRSYTGHRRFITIPDYINGKVVSSIGEEAFKGETRLRQVNLPKYLVRIRRSAFEGCANIIGMKIPDTVKEIGLNAFYGDTRLSYVEFGSNSTLETIGDAAFAFCGKIQRFEVPKNVKYLNGTAFFGDTGMTSISVRQGNNYFTSSGGVLFNKTASTLIAYPAGKSGTYTIPNIVREIGDCAFGYAKITEIDLDNVTTIGGSAFANSSLESVIIPDTVTSMGKEAFASNFYLKSVTLGRGLTVIPKKAFIYDFALTTITIPREIVIIDGGGMAGAFESSGLTSVTFEKNSSLAVIGDYAFSGTPLKSISIPASVMRIGGNAFGFDTSLSSVTFEQGSMLQSIGGAAFAYTYSLTTIAFPSNLREIGDYAFQGSGLDGDVTIPASLTSFGAGVFASCHDLENILVEVDNENYKDIDGVVFNINEDTLIEYPSGNTRTSYTIQSGVETVFDSAFYGSWNLTQIYLPEGLTYIQRYAFYDVENLMSMSMPDSVYMISNYAFAYDWNMSSVYFTENATLPRISYGAFAYSGLQSFRVPASVSTMAQGAFEGCKNLTSFTFAANSKLESISAYMFDGCDNLQSITFENGSKLTSIQAHGLEGMRRLTNVNFGNAALTNIDNFAFRFCESLGTLTIPSGVTYIGRYAFFGCKSMTTLTIPATVEYIGRYAFHYAENLDIYFEADDLPVYLQENWDSGIRGYYLSVSSVETSGDFRYAVLNSGNISIAEYTGTDTSVDLTTLGLGNIVTIGGHAFANSTVESITLPNTITSIHANAFSYSALKSISIPASVNFIGKEAFIGTPIETLTFASGSNLKVIEQKAFAKTTELTSVTIPKSVTTMGTGVFQESGLTTLAFENGIALEEIPQNAFYGTKITSVVIPGSVTLINHSAFRETANLTSVTFGTTNPVHIGSNVFYHSGLTSVNIPANITYIGEYAFVGLRSLTEFTVSADNPYYTTVNGLLMSKDGRKLITVPAGRTGTLTVPVSVEVIGFGAFEDSKLTSITFPVDANILTFGYRAFYNADGLTEMTIPASVVSINYYAFAMCDNLERITFADGSRLTGVYEGAFYGCKNLEDITLPDSIVEISDFAFYGCRKITEIPVSETSELLGVYSYSFAYSGIAGEFTTPETLIDIGDYAFMGTDITKLTIPDTNAETLVIGIGAFEDCNEITDITLPFIGASFEDSDITWFGYIFGAGGYEANATYVPKSLKNVRIEHTHGTIDNWGSVYSSKALSWIESIYLGEGATSIGNNAFDYCENLKSIRIPNSVTEIGSAAFSGCGITSFEIPSGVKTINSGTFSCCTSLTSIEIPSSIKSIEERAFSLCESLYKVINHSDLTF